MQGLSLPLRARVCTARCTARCAVLEGVGLRREGTGKGAVNSHAAPMGRRKDATHTLSSSYPRGTKFGVAETDDVCKVAILAMLADTVARDSRRKTATRFSPRGTGLFSPPLLLSLLPGTKPSSTDTDCRCRRFCDSNHNPCVVAETLVFVLRVLRNGEMARNLRPYRTVPQYYSVVRTASIHRISFFLLLHAGTVTSYYHKTPHAVSLLTSEDDFGPWVFVARLGLWYVGV